MVGGYTHNGMPIEFSSPIVSSTSCRKCGRSFPALGGTTRSFDSIRDGDDWDEGVVAVVFEPPEAEVNSA